MAVVHSLVWLSVHLAHISVPLSVTSLALSSPSSAEASSIAAVKQAARETNVFIACPPKEKASARYRSRDRGIWGSHRFFRTGALTDRHAPVVIPPTPCLVYPPCRRAKQAGIS